MTAMKEKTPLVRIEFGHEPVEKRITHFHDFTIPLTETEAKTQASRCLHCGTPFCSGNCPLHNRPVDFNRLVKEGNWRAAWECLSSTSSFPEFTSRICPAICEAGCTQYRLEDSAVGIRSIERSIIDRAWKSGWVKPLPAPVKTGRKVAVVGSGPAGLACAQQLARAGHDVTVYEKAEKAGGLLRYGIPDFKLEKELIDARLDQMAAEGVRFELLAAVGSAKFDKGVHNPAERTVEAADVLASYDAVVLAVGSETPRDIDVPGRNGKGVYFALDLLQEQNRVTAGEKKKASVTCSGCDVMIIGGGDTSSDCAGIARRQGAGRIVQIEHRSCPPEKEDKEATWPDWPYKLRTSTSQEEGVERLWDSTVKEIVLDAKGAVKAVKLVKLKWTKDEAGRWQCSEIEGSTEEVKAERVLIAAGFLHPSSNVLAAFGVEPDARGNAKAEKSRLASAYATSVPKVFACGDARSGQSLVVRAMSEGRSCAAAVDRFLMGSTELPQLA